MENKYCIMPEFPYCPDCKFGRVEYPECVKTYEDTYGCECKWMCSCTKNDMEKYIHVQPMYGERIWTVHQENNYYEDSDRVRRNHPKATINEIQYNSPLDLAVQLNDIMDLKDRINVDYIYTDYDLALREKEEIEKNAN